MANHISHASLPFPVKNARFTVLVPFLDAGGDPTDPATPDTEVSQDGGPFADAAEEVSTISGSNGLGFITLSGAEMNNSAVGVCFKVGSGPKATLMTISPRLLPVLSQGTASAGAAGSLTLNPILAYDITGMILRTNGGAGGGGTGGANNQARLVTAYNTSTGTATVQPNWETTPDNTTTYDVLYTEMAVSSPNGIVTTQTEWNNIVSRLDVAISTRLATASYTAPDNATIASIAALVAASAIRAAVGLEGANLDDRLDALPTNADLAEALTTLMGTALTESYAAQGAAPTRDQALMMVLQILTTFSITDNLNGTSTLTVKKLDGSTTAMTMTLNGDASTPPTSSIRAT